jgi:hypothetical protein
MRIRATNPLAAVSSARRAPGRCAAASPEEKMMADLPIVCTLTPEGLRARREGLLPDLVCRAEDRDELPDGLRLRFAPAGDTLSTIARTVEAEWLWAVEGQTPTRTDVIGAGLAIVGALVIIGCAARTAR